MNNFYTVLVIPEKTKQVKKIVLPTIYVRVGLLLGAVASFFLAFMIYDYVNVMRQLSENKRLQTENRQLKQQMQAFTTKLQSVQDALERIQSYTTKLRIITNQAGENSETLKKKVMPDIPGVPMDDHSDLPPVKNIPSGREGKLSPFSPARLLAANDEGQVLAVAEENAPAPTGEIRPNEEVTNEELTNEVVTNEVGPRKRPRMRRAPPPAEKKVEPELAPAPREVSAPPPAPPIEPAAADMLPPPPAPVELNDKTKLADLIREDQEQESAELRQEFSKLHQAFDSVLQHAQTVELDTQSLTSSLLDQRDYLNSLPTLKPTNGWYTSGFGTRSSPFTGKSTMHEGLDIANHIGSTIVAAAAGVITYAGPRPGYGNLVTINHGYGLQTQYGHISRAFVKVGQKVKRGEKIAAVGNTGRSTGPHVHYEVRVNGTPTEPYYFILED